MKKIIAFIAATLGAFALILVSYLNIQPFLAGASVQTGESYYSTTTPFAGQINGTSGVVLLKAYSPSGGILGSIIVTGGPKSGSFSLYDATTSDVNLRTGNKATSSIFLADIPAGTATTTYVFDTTFTTGLLLVTSGSVPTTTITWK